MFQVSKEAIEVGLPRRSLDSLIKNDKVYNSREDSDASPIPGFALDAFVYNVDVRKKVAKITCPNG